MKIILEKQDGKITILREKVGVILIYSAWGLFLAGFGLLFFLLIQGRSQFAVMQLFGFGFLGAAGYVFATMPKKWKEFQRNGGKKLAEFTIDGMTIFPEIGLKPISYKWEQIREICLVEKIVQKTSRAMHFGKNRLWILFAEEKLPPGFWEKVKSFRSLGPQREVYSIVGFPRSLSINEMILLMQNLAPESVYLTTAAVVELDHRRRKTTIDQGKKS